MRGKFRTIFPLINTQKTTIISLIRNKSIILGKLQTNRPMNHNLYQWIKEQKNSNLYQDNIFATILNGSTKLTMNGQPKTYSCLHWLQMASVMSY